jgi:hypothetical protein
MTFGPDLLISCPHCRNIYICNTIGSGNSAGAEFYSDGWGDAPMQPIPVMIVWCEKCNSWFFLDDAKELFELPFGVDPGEHKVIPIQDGLSIESYLNALKQPWPPEREKALRVRLMWEYNHSLRFDVSKRDPATIESHDNLERLAELLDPEKEALLLAEVHRELGEFPEAMDIARGKLPQGNGIKEGDQDEPPQYEGEALLARVILEEAERRNIFPVSLRQGGEDSEQLFAFPDSISHGFYPHPAVEDVFGLPFYEKSDHQLPLLSVHFSLVGVEEDGWATFCYNQGNYLYRFDRLFTPEDWDRIQALDDQSLNELVDFWDIKSYQIDQLNRQELDFYYNIRFRLSCGLVEPPLHGDYDRHMSLFRPRWEPLRKDLPPGRSGAEEIMLFWKLFWSTCTGITALEKLDRDLIVLFLEAEREIEKKREMDRSYALAHLHMLELEPAGDRGQEKSQKKSQEEELPIGQIWSDYLGYGSRLLSLSYLPEKGAFIVKESHR